MVIGTLVDPDECIERVASHAIGAVEGREVDVDVPDVHVGF